MKYCTLNECAHPDEAGLCAECTYNYGKFDEEGNDTGEADECDYAINYRED